ncbi:hypothetical protein IF1G_08922 [Cordyceps javanica]|uniref:Uncharacterized protein n=1 Tax=Cordyceps javanica TaxID=43265 RepID=A0A545USG2_9HYPO|nr:hypothetical protein IF1G_08922 [Cordyceps javanica]
MSGEKWWRLGSRVKTHGAHAMHASDILTVESARSVGGQVSARRIKGGQLAWKQSVSVKNLSKTGGRGSGHLPLQDRTKRCA